MFATIRLQFIAKFRETMKWWSMRLNVVQALVVMYIVMNPGDVKEAVQAIVEFFPDTIRPVVAMFCGFISFTIVYLARNVKQPVVKKDGE